jgi:Asp/Glu/hydantoin racemase
MLENNMSLAMEKAATYFESYNTELNTVEKSQIIALLIRCYVDSDDLDSAKKYLNATVIGECFKTSSQRLNLILSELGLVEKDVEG